MRVVAGEYKGRVIESPKGDATRPTTDRVRESVFSSVYSRLPELDGIDVLDAFAGSGALGIEALSRGAASCTFFDLSRDARQALERNLASLGLRAPRVQVLGTDAFDAVRSRSLGPFGLVLLDPPYACEAARVRGLLDALAQRGSLDDGCVVVYEHALASAQAVADAFDGDPAFRVTGRKKYGKIGVTYLEFEKAGE